MAKRALDLLVAGVALVVLGPLLVGIGMLVRGTSRGPALYRAPRTGRDGTPFQMYKFRTMVVDADRIGGTSTSARDPRITPIGHVLRRYKLDELPQLLNVLTGEMSLVGPRPEVEEYTSLYSAEEQAILSVPPGMTDLASVQLVDLNRILAHADDPDAYYRDVVRPRKNRLRLLYARHHSFALDAWILAATLRALVRRRAAAGQWRAEPAALAGARQ